MLHRLQRLWALVFLLAAPSAALAQQPVYLDAPPAEALEAGPAVLGARVACTGGTASGYACQGIDLMAFLPIASMGGAGARLNDIWGWTDPQTGREYAIVGRTDGTAFVDVTLPESPVYLGFLPTTPGTVPTSWRDIKVYADHAFIVSEATGHGMQVFDLKQLRGLTPNAQRLFTETALYTGVSNSHNLVVNEQTGFAFAVGSRATTGGPSCGRGLHIINIQTPATPAYAGCFTDLETGRARNGYTHDAQCVVYRGPDTRYTGREICFAANETAISLADVTDKAAPTKISSLSYPGVAYTHQGWLSPDQRYFFVDDELDESNGLVPKTRTLVFDLLKLDNPSLINQHFGTENTIDHNQYVVGRYSFQANYTSGLRVLDVSDPINLREVAFFDTYPAGNSSTQFLGLWSVYPFFASGNVVVSDITGGLFVLRPTAISLSNAPEALPDAFALSVPGIVRGQTTITLRLNAPQHVRVAVYDVAGREVARLADRLFEPGAHPLPLQPGALASGTYFVRAVGTGAATTQSFVYLR